MDVKVIFNIFLLSLVFTTIVITILSYILFRLRMITGKKYSGEKHKLSGRFFKRYAPHLKEINEMHNKEEDDFHVSKKRFRVKLGIGFLVLFLTVFMTFLLEDKLIFRYEIRKKQLEAKGYRELVEKGLMKKHDFDTYVGTSQLTFTLSPLQLNYLDNLKRSFKGKSFVLFESSRDKKLNFNSNRTSLLEWEHLLNGLGFQFKKTNSLIEALSSEYITIFPDVLSFSGSERDKIKKKILKGKVVIATGDWGAKNGLGGAVKESSFITEILKLQRGDNKVSVPVISRDVFKNRAVYSNLAVDVERLQMSTMYHNSKTVYQHRAIGILGKGKVLWFANAPSSFKGNTGPLASGHQYAISIFFLEKMSEVLNLPIVNIKSLPFNSSKFIVPLLTCEEGNSNKKLFRDMLSEITFPYTVFHHENRLSYEFQDWGQEAGIYAEGIEFVNKSKKHLFSLLEGMRFNLEEDSRRKVGGMLLTTKSITPNILDAALQNKLSYLVLSDEVAREGIPLLYNNSIMIFDNIIIDDNEFLFQKNNDSVEKVSEYFLKLFDQKINKGLVVGVLIQTKNYKKEFNKKVLTKINVALTEKKAGVRTLSEVANWFLSLSNLKVSFKRNEKVFELEVQNLRSVPVENVLVEFDAGTDIELVEDVTKTEGRLYALKIESLNPKEKKVYKFKVIE